MYQKHINRTVSVAPMMDWTDRHCRYFHRIITRNTLLYTEMVTTGALIHGDRDRYLLFNDREHPVALQLGGSNPDDLAICAKMVEDYGYDEVNLNVGCPSDRVQNGRFGACLMAEPELVGECISVMKNSVSIPVTVKSRIGIDGMDSYQDLVHFVATVAAGGCETFIIHARKAWLKGLSPKQNREIPPLRYDMVYQLKQDFSHLGIILNGGITSMEQVEKELQQLEGVMLGREAYHNPYILAEVDHRFYKSSLSPKTRHEIVHAFIPYLQQQIKSGIRLSCMTRHILGLFHGQPGAKGWRRYISENACKPDADETVVLQALSFIQA